MRQYLNLLKDILDNGHTHEDRTGVGRRSVFGRELRFNLAHGEFPLVTTRKVFTRGLIAETLWFLTGSTNALELEQQGVNIWKLWTPTEEDALALVTRHAKELELPDSLQQAWLDKFMSQVGHIGPMYGAVWRGNYHAGNGEKGLDQIASLIHGLKTNPFGSRHTVTAQIPDLLPLPNYSPRENALLGKGALAPCHCFFQCFVSPPYEEGGKLRLSLKLEIRSSDGPVGLPYNIAQYAMLLMLFAQCAGMSPGELIVSIGDAHIYTNQLVLVSEQLGRTPLPLSQLVINPGKTDIFSFTPEDIVLKDYVFHPVLNYPVAY